MATHPRIRRENVIREDPDIRANPDGNFGCGTVYINFSETPTEIKPLNNNPSRDASAEHESDAYEASLKKDWALQHEMAEAAGKPCDGFSR